MPFMIMMWRPRRRAAACPAMAACLHGGSHPSTANQNCRILLIRAARRMTCEGCSTRRLIFRVGSLGGGVNRISTTKAILMGHNALHYC